MDKLEEKILSPLTKTGRGFYFLVFILLGFIGLGVFAWITQLIKGLGVTGMNKPVFWGVYITNFVFFIGISHAGTLISAILRVCRVEWRRPITRCAEAITVFALLCAAPQVLFDIGRPDRIWQIIIHGRFQSPILWDVICIATYLTCSIIYLYLPLIPDIAIARDKLQNISRWRKWLYQKLSLNWMGTEVQRHRLNTGIGVLMIAIIPIAVSVHTVVSWIFGMTLQPMWHSTIFGPYFVVGAIYSGIASLLIAMAILRKVYKLEGFIKPIHFNNLGILLLTMNALWFYFTFAEYLTTFYGNEPSHMAVFISKFMEEYSGPFWTMVICMTVAFFILAFRKTRTIPGTVIASILINIGMWLERFTIIVPTLTRPVLPYAKGIYHPTWVEWSITLASFSGFILLYVIFSKLFPIISIWEMKEGKEKAIKEVIEIYKTYEPEVG
jgi:Ni/Fe-hydrogenase subunit HybB-like protein